MHSPPFELEKQSWEAFPTLPKSFFFLANKASVPAFSFPVCFQFLLTVFGNGQITPYPKYTPPHLVQNLNVLSPVYLFVDPHPTFQRERWTPQYLGSWTPHRISDSPFGNDPLISPFPFSLLRLLADPPSWPVERPLRRLNPFSPPPFLQSFHLLNRSLVDGVSPSLLSLWGLFELMRRAVTLFLSALPASQLISSLFPTFSLLISLSLGSLQDFRGWSCSMIFPSLFLYRHTFF